jgi:hypothetical protein
MLREKRASHIAATCQNLGRHLQDTPMMHGGLWGAAIGDSACGASG